MKVTEHLNNASATLFSLEILPPLKGKSIESIFEGIDPLIEFKPAFIDVTYHREEYVFKTRQDGLMEKIITRKRPGTVGISAAIMNKYKVDVVPHILCGGFDKEETENTLIDLHFLGIDNILALRGDKIKNEASFLPNPKGNHYAIDLVKQTVDMNKGCYLDDELINATPSNFCIGVAAYPEKHEEAPNFATDLHYLKQKVEAGAEYIVTQMFFDNEKFFQFVAACRANGITVPIIPGLKPITTRKQLTILPKTFHIDLPEALSKEILKCSTDKQVFEVGVEWAIAQCKELIAKNIPCLHFYTMGKSEATRRIASQVM